MFTSTNRYGTPVSQLLPLAHCDYASTHLLTQPQRVQVGEFSGPHTDYPVLADGIISCQIPQLVRKGKQLEIHWTAENEPAIKDLLEAAGFYRLLLLEIPDAPVEPQLITPTETIDLHPALILWQRLYSHWQNLATTPLPAWFSRGILRACGSCSICRAQMQNQQDAALLPSVGMKRAGLLEKELGVRTIGELARYTQNVPADWAQAVGEAALREKVKRPEADALRLAQVQWDEKQVAKELELLAAERTRQLLEEETLPLEIEPPSAAEERLLTYVASLPTGELTPTDQAVAMIASATGYHRRERTQFWVEHFERVYRPVHEWALGKGVGVVQDAQLVQDWEKDPERPRAAASRIFDVWLRVGESFVVRPGDKGLCLYYGEGRPDYLVSKAGDLALKFEEENGRLPAAVLVPDFRGEVLEVAQERGVVRVRLREALRQKAEEFSQLPVALGPASPLPTKAHEAALLQLAEAVGDSLPELPESAALDIAARRPPRLVGGGELPPLENFEGEVPLAEALIALAQRLDSSYLAVQGPPGAGKTFVGSQVLGALCALGWKIGVVAQSHAVVENMLSAALAKGGVPAEQVAKFRGKSQAETPQWTEVSEADLADALAADKGLIIGGTAWDFASEKKFPAESLDLLVVDEAGQYSLANTFAVARAARNLLLLGDPQQLPQVTQGEHPHHVEESALGWLIGSAPTLPQSYGYFMDRTWRMHPNLCAAVSQLSYGGLLESAPAASQRTLEGWHAGIYLQEITHDFNTTSSPEEVATIITTAQDFLGTPWQDGATTRPLTPNDILIVAAYNSQVDALKEALTTAGIHDIRVGTVDKFQGQEAPVVLISMAASTPIASLQTAEFLLSPNRLNVAISRGQWCAVLILSKHFTRYLPRNQEELQQLTSFINLLENAKTFPKKRNNEKEPHE